MPADRDSSAAKERAWAKLPPLEHVHSGCLNCGGKPIKVPLRYNPHPGFGASILTRDGEAVEFQVDYEKSTTFIHFENVAKRDPDHDWRVFSDGPMVGFVWQRHGPKEWVAVERTNGFA